MPLEAKSILLEELEEQLGQLSLSQQLDLLNFLTEQLSKIGLLKMDEDGLRQQREDAADIFMASVDIVAARGPLGSDEPDGSERIRQMREDRHSQIEANSYHDRTSHRRKRRYKVVDKGRTVAS